MHRYALQFVCEYYCINCKNWYKKHTNCVVLTEDVIARLVVAIKFPLLVPCRIDRRQIAPLKRAPRIMGLISRSALNAECAVSKSLPFDQIRLISGSTWRKRLHIKDLIRIAPVRNCLCYSKARLSLVGRRLPSPPPTPTMAQYVRVSFLKEQIIDLMRRRGIFNFYDDNSEIAVSSLLLLCSRAQANILRYSKCFISQYFPI